MYRIKRRKTKRIRTGEVPRLSGYGDLATIRLAGTKAATGLSRTSTVGGIDRMGKFARNENLGPVEVTAPPYGALAVGAGLAALGAGAAAAFAPLSGTVKILLTALGIASAGGCAYSLKKRAEVSDVKIQSGIADRLMRGSANWLQSISQVPEIKAKLEADRVQSFFKYNTVSSVAKFVKFDDRMMTAKDPVTGEGVTTYFDSYPDWVDTMQLTVGEKEFQRAIHNTIHSVINEKISRASEQVGWMIPPGDHVSPFLPVEDEEAGLMNNFGLLNKDAFLEFRGCKFLACSLPPLRGDRPVYYHIINGRMESYTSGTKLAIHNKYVNAANYEEVRTDIDNVPPNALIVGSRFTLSPDAGFDFVQDVWRRFSALTYNEIFANPSILVDNPYLAVRPDLWPFSIPCVPSTVTTGKPKPDILPFLRPKGDFFESGLFQPFLLNCKFFVMEKQEFLKLKALMRYEQPTFPDPVLSQLAQVLRVGAIVVSVAAAVVTTVASFGTASVPAWAATVTTIAAVLGTSLTLAAKWIEQAARGYSGSIMEGIVDVWNGMKGIMTTCEDKLDIHFSACAAAFVEKVRRLTGRVIAETDLQNQQIMYALKMVGNDLRGNYSTFRQYLGGVIPELPSSIEGKLGEIEGYIVSNTQVTNELFMQAKHDTEMNIRSQIADIDGKLMANAVTKLAVLF